jgi:hypothetical protein
MEREILQHIKGPKYLIVLNMSEIRSFTIVMKSLS